MHSLCRKLRRLAAPLALMGAVIVPPSSSKMPAVSPGRQAGTTASAMVARGQGATLKAGRFTLLVPAGAVREQATIRMSVTDPASAICTLDISPESANRFETPMQLSASMQDVPASERGKLEILLYDPTSRGWSRVDACRRDNVCNAVSGSLRHFSIYCIGNLLTGRAGW